MNITNHLKRKLKELMYILTYNNKNYYLCIDYHIDQNNKYCEYIGLDGETIQVQYVPADDKMKRIIAVEYFENKYSELEAFKHYIYFKNRYIID